MEKDWLFPYLEIEKGSKIVIYGAGKIGEAYYKQCIYTEYCDVVLWCDSKFESINTNVGVVESPEKIRDVDFDKVIIAVATKGNCIGIFNKLSEMHVPYQKIWSPYDDLSMEINKKALEFPLRQGQGTLDKKHLDIAVIAGRPIQGSGGVRNIYRMVSYLRDFGHHITVYYIDSKDSPELIKTEVSKWFYDMEGVNFIAYQNDMNYHDVGIATWWKTAYVLDRQKSKIRRGFYFVQDYEPYFYPVSSNYIMADNSYKLGLYHICSGKWSLDIIKNKHGSMGTYFNFPVDTIIYNLGHKAYTKKGYILFFAKPEMPRRCYEIGVEILSEYKRIDKDTEIIMYGSDNINAEKLAFPCKVLGIVPTLYDLAELYRNAKIGLVFSTTNPSLVPYEMMSCGCPVADLDFDGALSKYGDNEKNVFLLDVTPHKAALQLNSILSDDSLLQERRTNAYKWVKENFPDEIGMARIVENALLSNI